MTELENIIKQLNKDLKTGNITIGANFSKVARVPLSSCRINYMLHGGIPKGRIIEFSGKEGGGKTTVALDLSKQCQKLCPEKTVVYVDVEHTLDLSWARLLGVDTDSMIYFDPDNLSAEAIFNTILKLLNSGEISLCVLDSIGALVSDEASRKDIGQRTYGGVSNALTEFSNKVTPVLARTDAIFLGINQIRDEINNPWGGTRTVGGKSWKHACSVRLAFKQGSYIDADGNDVSRAVENPAGNKVVVELVKSKICPPDRKVGFFTLRYLDGIDYVADLVDMAITNGIIEQRKSWFYLNGYRDEDNNELKFQGKDKMLAYIKSHEELYNDLSSNLLLTNE